jgi:hypothetical protein
MTEPLIAVSSHVLGMSVMAAAILVALIVVLLRERDRSGDS